MIPHVATAPSGAEGFQVGEGLLGQLRGVDPHGNLMVVLQGRLRQVVAPDEEIRRSMTTSFAWVVLSGASMQTRIPLFESPCGLLVVPADVVALRPVLDDRLDPDPAPGASRRCVRTNSGWLFAVPVVLKKKMERAISCRAWRILPGAPESMHCP